MGRCVSQEPTWAGERQARQPRLTNRDQDGARRRKARLGKATSVSRPSGASEACRVLNHGAGCPGSGGGICRCDGGDRHHAGGASYALKGRSSSTGPDQDCGRLVRNHPTSRVRSDKRHWRRRRGFAEGAGRRKLHLTVCSTLCIGCSRSNRHRLQDAVGVRSSASDGLENQRHDKENRHHLRTVWHGNLPMLSGCEPYPARLGLDNVWEPYGLRKVASL
jgi:hypothetical protein